MNHRNFRIMVLASGLGAAALFAVPAIAQQVQRTRAALEGIWSLVSVANEKDGVKSATPMGINPPGLFIFDRSGHYAVQLYREGLKPIAANDRTKGTAEENAAIVAGSLSHFGTFTVDESAGVFKVRPVASNYPNWVGKDLPRRFEVTGNQLKIINPSSSADPTTTSYLLLKRVK